MPDDSDELMPASLAAAWGLRARPGKGPKPGLTLDGIVAAGVRVATSEGLAAVSMSRVAAELGAATMSLYRYVTAKQELLDLMVDAAIGVAPEPVEGEGWRAGLTRFARTHLTLLRSVPWVVRVPITGPPITPNQISWMNYGLTVLRDTGLEEYEKLSAIMTLAGHVRNWALLTADMTASAEATGTTTDEAIQTYGRLLTRLVDPARFPAVAELIASGILNLPAGDPDEDFEFGLDRLLDGFDVLIQRRRADPSCAPDPVLDQFAKFR